MRSFSHTAALAVIAGLALPAIAQPCDPGWSALGTGVTGPYVVLSMTVFDDGSGPALYVGTNGGASAVKRWNGSEWIGVGTNILGDVNAIIGFDHGTGPQLYALGHF